MQRMARTQEAAMAELDGKVALITGAQQGIGAAIAVAMARAGADIAINYLDDQGAAGKVAEQVRSLGRRVVLIQGSVTDLAACNSMVETTVRELGHIDILVNNAGLLKRVLLV